MGTFLLIDDEANRPENLDNKIVVIPAADPGWDWIFNYKIKSLITKYGGPNSHMAIRCAEHNIPAILGVGENNFYSYSKLKKFRNRFFLMKAFQMYKYFRNTSFLVVSLKTEWLSPSTLKPLVLF